MWFIYKKLIALVQLFLLYLYRKDYSMQQMQNYKQLTDKQRNAVDIYRLSPVFTQRDIDYDMLCGVM